MGLEGLGYVPCRAATYLSSFLRFQKLSGTYAAFFPVGTGYSSKAPPHIKHPNARFGIISV